MDADTLSGLAPKVGNAERPFNPRHVPKDGRIARSQPARMAFMNKTLSQTKTGYHDGLTRGTGCYYAGSLLLNDAEEIGQQTRGG